MFRPERVSEEGIRDNLHHLVTVRSISRSYLNQAVSAIKFIYGRGLYFLRTIRDLPRPRSERKLPQDAPALVRHTQARRRHRSAIRAAIARPSSARGDDDLHPRDAADCGRSGRRWTTILKGKQAGGERNGDGDVAKWGSISERSSRRNEVFFSSSQF